MQSVHHLQALADPTRLRLLALLEAGPLCVCHLQAVLGEPQAKVSKHLAILRRRGLVTARRDGTWMVYALAVPAPAALGGLPDLVAAESRLQRDRQKLARLDLSCSPAGGAGGGCGGKVSKVAS
jgi:ArsR family transcriptional regulator